MQLDLYHIDSPVNLQDVDLHSYDMYIVAFSGGKDSTALVLHLLDQGVDKNKIELWHHDVDGKTGNNFFDWPITSGYVRAFANAFGLKIYFSWKEGGFKRELLRENSLTAPTSFECADGSVKSIGGIRGNKSTRRKYPQISSDLSVRYCSASLKIDVCSAAISNQERFNHSRTLVLSGERGEESAARAKYNIFEPDRADNRKKDSYTLVTTRISSKGKHFQTQRHIQPGLSDRHVDRYRPIRDWTEEQVWDIIRRYNVRVHPAYYLGWSRCSCLFCIFGNANAFRSGGVVCSDQLEEVIRLEKEFGVTMKRNESLEDLLKKGVPYAGVVENKALVEVARSKDYHLPIFMDEWVLPSGAFGVGCGTS